VWTDLWTACNDESDVRVFDSNHVLEILHPGLQGAVETALQQRGCHGDHSTQLGLRNTEAFQVLDPRLHGPLHSILQDLWVPHNELAQIVTFYSHTKKILHSLFRHDCISLQACLVALGDLSKVGFTQPLLVEVLQQGTKLGLQIDLT
jgi:hypothetical protein